MKVKLLTALSGAIVLIGLFSVLDRETLDSQGDQDKKKEEPGQPGEKPRPIELTYRSQTEMICSKLSGTTSKDDAGSLLKELKKNLSAMPSGEARNFILTYFSAGSDQRLPLAFKVGRNGQLETAPTLRTALLDHLAMIDASAAARLGREILTEPTSADEWALALRNVARVEPGSRDFLRQKTEELIQNPEWQASPSSGYFNAFDVLVHTRADESTPLLSTLVQNKDRHDLAHASFLTLDRLTMASPETMLPLLAKDSSLHQARPEMTAQQMARADFRQTNQREIVREWILAPERTSTELQSFAKTFPNGNMMVSNNLLTVQNEVSGSDLRNRDVHSLQVVEAWLASEEFKPVQNHLLTMKDRLHQFVKQAEAKPDQE